MGSAKSLGCWGFSWLLLGCLGFLGQAQGEPSRPSKHLIVEAQVDGKPVRLMVDTGAEVMSLFRATASRLNLKRLSKFPAEPPVAGKIAHDGIVEGCLRLPGWGRPIQTQFPVAPDPPVPMEFDGVVGWSVLKLDRFALDGTGLHDLDIPKDLGGWQVWTLAPESKDPQGYNAAVIEIHAGHPEDGLILLDTGAAAPGLMLCVERLKAWCSEHPQAPVTLDAGVDMYDGIHTFPLLWAESLELGPVMLDRIMVKPLSSKIPQFQAILDLGTLAHFDLVFDGPNLKVYARPRTPPPLMPDYNKAGAAFIPEGEDGVLTAHVLPGSPAARSGVRDGDILLRIGDLDVTRWKTDPSVSPNQPFRVGRAGDKLQLHLLREGKAFEATVVLEELFGKPSR